MKVRHKATGIELEVKEESFSYWATSGRTLISKTDYEWELVKEEEWEDCTESCECTTIPGTDYSTIFCKVSQSLKLNILHQKYSGSYRLRKIDGLHHGPAFIVEKRKEA